MNASTVWKVIDKFSRCGLIEPKSRVRVPLSRGSVKDAWGNPIERTNTREFRSEVPVRLLPLGRRVAQLMGFARREGIFELGPQEKRLSENDDLLAKFKQAGFTEEEVKAALCAGVICDEPKKLWTPGEGMIQDPIAAAFQPRYVEIRYKYKQV